MPGEEEENHIMILQATHESGAEEWYCPACGRRFLMQWPPNYRRIILEPGDGNAIHSGGKGGVSMSLKIAQNPKRDLLPGETPEAEEDGRLSTPDQELLAPWQAWMDRVNFDKLWQDGLTD